MSLISLKKSVCSVLIGSLFFTQVFTGLASAQSPVIEPAEAPNNPTTVYDLVTVVIDADVDRDSSSYEGLINDYPSRLNARTVSERIIRYAEDVRDNNELTDVKILIFDDSEDTVADLAAALENLYLNGDGSHNNRLAGVVLVGDVPLPVVNKEGNRFVSVFPYVDFEDKAYVHNSETNSFERNTESVFPKPEIWHGVISASQAGYAGMGELAEFFDKNHLYYAGEPEYAEFDKKIFFGDLIHEEENMNEDIYSRYVRYLDSLEDTAYMRYNKYWARDLMQETLGEFNDGEGLPINTENPTSAQFAASLEGDPTSQMPDIFAKNIIEQYLIPYYRNFSRYISRMNDFAEGTGRYTAADVDSMPLLITVKDEYTKHYLRVVNDALEEKVNEVVAMIEEPLPLLSYSVLTGGFVDADGDVDEFEVNVRGTTSLMGIPVPDDDDFDEVYIRYHYPYYSKIFINGVDADVIESAKLCAPYLGSSNTDSGEYSILTRSVRTDNISTAAPLYTIGVNTRILSPTEAYSLTSGAVSYGAVIESNPEYGISAFILNPYREDINFANPIAEKLRAGDVITKINGVELSSSYTLDDAAAAVFNAANQQRIRQDDDEITANITIEFYRGNQGRSEVFSFEIDDGETMVSMDPFSPVLIPQSDGAIFTLYNATSPRFHGYDNSIGCNAASSRLNSDRCFYPFAKMPVLDPAGSTAPVATFVPGVGEVPMFPEYVGTDTPAAWADHMNILQLTPEEYADIDEVYYNACYAGIWDVGDFGTEDDFGLYSNLLNDVQRFIEENSNYSNRPGFSPSKSSIWNNLDQMTASSVVLNNDGYRVTLNDFAVRYGITSNNLAEVARKMLSQNGSYIIPASANPLNKDIILNVTISGVVKTISSMIIHNEPTGYTITRQLESLGTPSLPIDNPRYVAFQNQNKQTYKILYPNTFDAPNHAQFEANLASLAFFIAQIPGSYKIFGPNTNAADYQALDIQNKILTDYFIPVIDTGPADYPNDVDLESTSEEKLLDAISWLNFGIDDKHEYILERYLNDGYNAFVNDKTLFPAPSGYELDYGYEAAYLVLDGEDDYFEMNFNKDLPIETNENFDELALLAREGAFGEEEVSGAGGAASGAAGASEGDDFVDLWKFLNELMRFINAFTVVPEFKTCCGYASEKREALENEEAGVAQISHVSVSLPSSLNLSVDKNIVFADGTETITVTVEGLDGEVVSLNVAQSSANPIFEFVDLNSKTLFEGAAVFTLATTENTGSVALSASSGTGLISNSVSVVSSNQHVELVSYTYFTPEGIDELEAQIAAAEDELLIETEQQAEELLDEFLVELGVLEQEVVVEEVVAEAEEVVVEEVVAEAEEVVVEEVVAEAEEVVETLSPEGEVVLEEILEEEAERQLRILMSEPIESEVEGGEVEVGSGEVLEWEEYFLIQDYYLKFIQEAAPEARASRLLAEVYSDRMLAYVSDNENPFIDARENEESEYVLQSEDSMLADGQSLMMVNASVFDVNGMLEVAGSHQVKFSIIESDFDNMVSFENGNIATSNEGVATIYLRAGTVSGHIKIRAEVMDGQYPPREKDLYLLAGEPASVEITADSYVLVANDQSSADVTIILKDEFGNVCDNSFAQAALFVNEEAHFDANADTNTQILGTQLSTFSGTAETTLYAEDEVGEVSLIALLMSYELEEEFLEVGSDWQAIDFSQYIGTSKTFTILDDVSLDITADQISIPADGQSVVSFRTSMMNNGQVVADYSGPVNFTILNNNLGNFVSASPSNMVNGVLHEANVRFRSSTLAGQEEILVEAPGFASNTITFNTLAGPVAKLELTASSDTLHTGGYDELILEARLLDANDNLATNNNSTLVNFAVTPATADFVEFTGAPNALALNGVASIIVKGGDASGKANILATVLGTTITAPLPLDVVKHVTNIGTEDFAPRSLYISLLGGGFGNIAGNNLAQTLLYNGQAQAVSSLTTSNSESAGGRFLFVDAYGKIDVLDDTVSMTTVAATDSFPYQKIVFSDFAEMFFIPKANAELTLIEEGAEIPDTEGIFVKRLSEADTEIEFVEEGGSVYIKKAGNVLASVDGFGRVSLSDANFELNALSEDDEILVEGFALIIRDRGEVLALIEFKQDFGSDVANLDYDEVLSAYYPGVYLRMNSLSDEYGFVSAFSGASTDEAMGLYVVNTELESVSDVSGFGFDGDNKHMLLFAAGNSVGESHIPYASDAGIIFGDPTIRLKLDGIVGLISQLSGYTRDIGKSIFASDEDIVDLVTFDYNGDSLDDLLLVYGDGSIRLLENEISNKRFRDRGYILKIYGGLYSAARIDVNNDGYDDLIAGTKDSCLADEQCVSLFINNEGHFDRSPLNLAIEGKIFEMKSGDMNADGCEDLVASDSAGNIRIFYNQNNGAACTGLSVNYGGSFNFGFSIDSQEDSKNNLFINYAGMEAYVADSNAYKFISIMLPTTQLPVAPSLSDAGDFAVGDFYSQYSEQVFAQDAAALQQALLSNSEIASLDIESQTYDQEFHFTSLLEDSRFINSTKQMVDENGGSVAVGDNINVLITLRNGMSGNASVMLSDLIPATMTFLPESVQCLDTDCPLDMEVVESGIDLRPYVIKNLTVPAGGVRTIKYTMTVDVTPEVNFDLGTNFTDFVDNYLDIFVRPSFNPDGILTYLYSTGVTAGGYVQYEQTHVLPSGSGASGNADFVANMDEVVANSAGSVVDQVSLEMQEQINQQVTSLSADADYDGYPDSWGSGSSGNSFVDDAGAIAGVMAAKLKNAAQAIANGLQDIISALRCNGAGCMPIPYNYALFAPDGPTTGIAAFAAGVPFLPFFSFFYPSSQPSSFRFYVCPTLTMGLGFAVCAGPNPATLGCGTFPPPLLYTCGSPCFAFAIPAFSGVCDAFMGPITDAIAAAKNAVSNPDIGMATVVSDGRGSAGTEAVTGNFSYTDPDFPISTGGAANIRIPGFPSVITNWLDYQTDEIFNKLLDLPDLYFIYPDVKSLISETSLAATNFSNIKNIHDFLRALNSIPLVQIETKEVLLKIPALSKNEWLKWKRQADLWIKYEEDQIDRVREYWTCDENPYRKTLCDTVTVNMRGLIQSIRKLMNTLDRIANLPRDILTWRNLESKYATQIICYLDAIMMFTGGYIKRQDRIIQSWMKAIEDTIRTVKGWKALLDLSAKYQASCDQCKNDRFSKLGFLLQLFAAIPAPPIIPMPKWPDIVFDVSQIKTGIKIVWPDLRFRPEPIKLPNLPYVTLPEVLPELVLTIPGFGEALEIPDFPSFMMPPLPDLPPLPIPKLPDLPRPPRIPQLPDFAVTLATSLKIIFKILCLLKTGILPVPETALATQIKTLTQPSVQAVLPIIKALAVKMPAIKYNYVDKINISAKLNMGIDFSVIHSLVQTGASKMNTAVRDIIQGLNRMIDLPIQQLIDTAVRAAESAAQAAVKEATSAVEEAASEIESSLPLAYEPSAEPYLEVLEEKIHEFSLSINSYAENLEIENYPDTYYLTAEQEFIDSSHPLLNRSIEEIESQDFDIPDTPEMQRLADLRDALIAYTKNLDDSNAILSEIEDYNSFTTLLAETDEDLSRIAALSVPYTETKSVEKLKIKLFENELIAANIDEGQFDGTAAALEAASGATPSVVPAGFYVAVGDQNESVLAYVAELSRTVHTLFNDVDSDGDHDIIFSLGGDVYLKENHQFEPNFPRGNIILNTNSAISDFLPEGGPGVQGVSSPYENNEKADISWLAVDGAVSYEIEIRVSLLDDEVLYTYPVEGNTTSFSVELENGNYYAVVYALNADGERSLISTPVVVSPQACADKDAPFPAMTTTDFDLSIYKTLEIDASASFDASGEVTEYSIQTPAGILWSDLNLTSDEDGDGLAWNDRSNPVFNIGPFTDSADLGARQMTLNVTDQSGNSSNQALTVNVFAPDIALDEIFARSAVATGETSPKITEIPFSLMRDRYIYRVVNKQLKLIPQLEEITSSTTDNNGEYEISNFDLDDVILVENASGEIVAYVDPETGNIENLTGSTVVNPAVVPTMPTSVDILDSDGSILATLYIFADPNIDARVHEGVNFDYSNYSFLSGVNVSDLNAADSLQWRVFPANDPYFAGGVALINIAENNEQVLAIDTAGNILILDERVSIQQKINNYEEDPLVIEVLFADNVAGEIYISPLTRNVLIVGPNDVPFTTPRSPAAATFYPRDSFGPVEFELDTILYDLYEREGIAFTPNEAVTRAEFAKVLLDMLCIIPRPEAYEPDSGFSDIAFSPDLPWYYAYIKEAALLGLVEGYKGEPDAVTGLYPFKPQATITRAEIVKIILEALEMKGVLDLSALSEGEPWYEPFMLAAQDLTPYITAGHSILNNFIITPDEALVPNDYMTRGDMVVMANRVLELYNCFEIDANNNGMSDFCEEKYNISDPYGDFDNDGALNLVECEYGIDPTDEDTDDGGALDGMELELATDPLNPIDDPGEMPMPAGEYTAGESGLYIVPAECTSCPCESTLLHKADIIPGDVFFTLISTPDNQYIFSKSNEVTMQ